MRGMIRLLSAVAIAGLATLAQPQQAEAQRSNGNGLSENSVVVLRSTVTRQLDVYACGEIVRFPITVEVSLIDQRSNGGNSNYMWHVRGRGKGTGSNGTDYIWGENVMIADRNAREGAFVSDLNWRSRLISRGKGPNYHFTLHSHYTVSSNGDFAADFYTSEVVCR